MKTKILTDKDEIGLNQQQWEWQLRSNVTIKKQWPDERLPVVMKPIVIGTKIEAQDQVSRRIDYDE